jgi:tetratricopeptide (TPR) repeat protein
MEWDDAAQTYLRLVANFPTSELSSASLYNAGFCFENAKKLVEAAATFEKHAMAFPNSKDAADILFKAGEIYGQLKDWESVTRVNKEFSHRFGNDRDRIVQAQCMVGVALYMQNKTDEAIDQLNKAISTFNSLNNPSDVNRYYAAKALFTIGDIYYEYQNKVALVQPNTVYKKLLKEKSQFLDKAVDAYSRVIKYKISEWTTRAIYQIGQSYEDFAIGIFKQERPRNLSLEKSLALEMGIAKAVEEYFIDNALRFHEQNAKLGIKEKIENASILNSKKKLTYLPYTAGENFLALLTITKGMDDNKSLAGFALIAHKLQTLQKMAPFQERAIGLFLKCLEMGTVYQEYNEFYTKASALITPAVHRYPKALMHTKHLSIKQNY